LDAHGDVPALAAGEWMVAALVTPAEGASEPGPGLAPLSELSVGAAEPASVDELSPVDGAGDPVPVDDESGPGFGLEPWICGLDCELEGEAEPRGLTVLQLGDGTAPIELAPNGL
jgi:hypothetical protein